jgi:GNAT superfamily N-acetyltransferase
MALVHTEIQIFKVSEDRLEELLDIQKEVCERLELAELYFPVSKDEMLEFLRPGGVCYAAAHGSKLVGFFGILLMGDRPDNIGYELGLEKDEILQVVYYKAVNVLPSYRRMGLQKRLTRAVFAELGVGLQSQRAGNFEVSSRVMCATISPHNIASLKSFFDCGFWIAGLKSKFNGLQRYLMMRRCTDMPVKDVQYITVPVTDHEAQKRLLSQGMLGIQFSASPGGLATIGYTTRDAVLNSGKDISS